MSNKITAIIIGSVFVALSIVHVASAETKAADDEWHFMVAPLFLWGMNIDGTSELGPVSTPLKLDFKDDILENLAGVFTLHFEASKMDWTFFAEYQYSNLDPSAETPMGPVANIDFKNHSII